MVARAKDEKGKIASRMPRNRSSGASFLKKISLLAGSQSGEKVKVLSLGMKLN